MERLVETTTRGLPHLCGMDSSIISLWTGPLQSKGMSDYFSYYHFLEIPIFNANSVYPDQTPRSAASDLGLHCLQMSHLWDARLKWVKLVLLDQNLVLNLMNLQIINILR